jgi:hypothetical protein
MVTNSAISVSGAAGHASVPSRVLCGILLLYSTAGNPLGQVWGRGVTWDRERAFRYRETPPILSVVRPGPWVP